MQLFLAVHYRNVPQESLVLGTVHAGDDAPVDTTSSGRKTSWVVIESGSTRKQTAAQDKFSYHLFCKVLYKSRHQKFAR